LGEGASVTEKEFSIWVAPHGRSQRLLAQLIFSLSEQYNSPTFVPHVTLLGSLHGHYESMEPKCSQLSSKLRPYTIRLTGVEYVDKFISNSSEAPTRIKGSPPRGHLYHNHVMIARAEKTENVLKANLIARGIFDSQNDPPYFPHASILYAKLSPALKEQAIKQAARYLPLGFEVDELRLVDTTEEDPRSYAVAYAAAKAFPFGHA